MISGRALAAASHAAGGRARQRVDPPERLSGGDASRWRATGCRSRSERFFSEPGVTGPERWPVPLVLRFGRRPGACTSTGLSCSSDGRARSRWRAAVEVRWLVRQRRLHRLLPGGVRRPSCSPCLATRTSERCAPPSASAAGGPVGAGARGAGAVGGLPGPGARLRRRGRRRGPGRAGGAARLRRGAAGGRRGPGALPPAGGAALPPAAGEAWAGTRRPARRTRRSCGGRRCCERWRAWLVHARCSPRRRRGWTGC